MTDLANTPRIKHGHKITEPGIYDIPMSWYHEDCCNGPSISSGGLRTILAKTPRAYWHTSPLNPDREPEAAILPPYIRIGQAAHTLAMEEHLYRELYVTRPDRWDSWRTNDAKKWRAEKQAAGFTVLDDTEVRLVIGIANSLREHPLFQQGLLAGHLEKSLIWQDVETGIWLKSRPDAIPVSANIFGDLKTMNDVNPQAVRRAIFERGYHIQLGLADYGLEHLLDRKMEEFVLVCVEQKPPHDILIAPIDPEAVGWGQRLAKKAIRIFADCWDKGRWPSYEAHDNEYVRVPDWLEKLYLADPELKA